MKDDKKYWLNEFGLRRWQHRTLPYELQREYHWVDKVSLLGNSKHGGGRPYHGQIYFTSLDELMITSYDGKLSFDIEEFEIIDKKYERRKKLEKIMIKKQNGII